MKKQIPLSPSSIRYVAFLLGINIGPHKKVPMASLKKMLERMGFTNIKTFLNSGNAMFEAAKTDTAMLEKKIEKELEKTFGFTVGVIARTIDDLQKIADLNPFQGLEVTKDTRLYVTFLSEKPKTSLTIPYTSEDKHFRILRVTPTEVCSVLELSPDNRTTDAMNVLGKEFGKRITTRNWNTIEKILR